MRRSASATLRRAFVAIAEADRAQAGDELLGFDQRAVAIGHAAAGGDQALERGGELLERGVAGGDADAGGGAGADHPRLQFGDLGQRGLDACPRPCGPGWRLR